MLHCFIHISMLLWNGWFFQPVWFIFDKYRKEWILLISSVLTQASQDSIPFEWWVLRCLNKSLIERGDTCGWRCSCRWCSHLNQLCVLRLLQIFGFRIDSIKNHFVMFYLFYLLKLFDQVSINKYLIRPKNRRFHLMPSRYIFS